MKKYFILTYLFIIFLINTNDVNSGENKILIKVNNQIITSLDIISEIKYLQTINENLKKFDNSKVIEIAKKSIIRDKIKEIELKKIFKEIKIQDEYFNEISKSYFNHLGINSKEDFQKYFVNEGIDPAQVRKKITLEILWNQLIYKKFHQNVKIDKVKIKKELLSKKSTQKEFLLSEILFTLDKGESLENKFNLIKKDILYKGFPNAALEHSISNSNTLGGDIGWIKESVLNPKIKKELLKLNKKKFTNPMVIPGGFLILQKVDIREIDSKIDIEKEMILIIDRKTNEQLNQFSNIHFNKIKKDITIYEL